MAQGVACCCDAREPGAGSFGAVPGAARTTFWAAALSFRHSVCGRARDSQERDRFGVPRCAGRATVDEVRRHHDGAVVQFIQANLDTRISLERLNPDERELVEEQVCRACGASGARARRVATVSTREAPPTGSAAFFRNLVLSATDSCAEAWTSCAVPAAGPCSCRGSCTTPHRHRYHPGSRQRYRVVR